MSLIKDQDVFVFTVNGYNEIVLRATRIAIVKDYTFIVEAYGEYKKENVYKYQNEAFQDIIKKLNSMNHEIDLPLKLKM